MMVPTSVEAAREAARKSDGKFGQQHHTAPEEQLEAMSAKFYNARYWATGTAGHLAQEASRLAQMDAISASVAAAYPSAVKAHLTWEDGDFDTPTGVQLDALLDAEGNVVADRDTSELLDQVANDVGFFQVDDWKDARNTFDSVNEDDEYTFDINRDLPEVTPERVRALEVQQTLGWSSPETHGLVTQLLEVNPEMADALAALSPTQLLAVQKAALAGAVAHIDTL